MGIGHWGLGMMEDGNGGITEQEAGSYGVAKDVLIRSVVADRACLAAVLT